MRHDKEAADMFRIASYAFFFAFPIAVTAQSGPPGAQSDNEKQLLAISVAWGDAEAKHDEAALDRYIDDRFLFITESGQIIDGKAAFIEVVRKFTFTSMTVMGQPIVRVHGDTAVVNGVFAVYKDGVQSGTPTRGTITYVKRNGQWKAVVEVLGKPASEK